jgi:ribosomal-protein-alanine N-acetyltransferase
MEQMPYRADLDMRSVVPSGEVIASEWQQGLPVLRGERVLLRELRASDAASLCALLNTEEVARFISPPPATVDGFERFIAWTHRQRTAGSYVCFAVTLQGYDTAIGIIQLRRSDRQFETAEWGFAIGSAFWGTGVFQESAALAIDFFFTTIGVRRLEARAALLNGRGAAALRNAGAVQECILRKSFLRNGEYLDQALFAILDSDRTATDAAPARGLVQIH